MTRKNIIYIAVTVLVALTLIWLSRGSDKQIPELESLFKNEENTKVENGTIIKKPDNMLEGILWSSDNIAKGNLMLVTGDATIYISTSRNFDELKGKNVVVTIDGAPDNFTLLNIEENLTKDGYIKQ